MQQERTHYRIYYCYNRFMDVESMRPHSNSKTMTFSVKFHSTKPVCRNMKIFNRKHSQLAVSEQCESVTYCTRKHNFLLWTSEHWTHWSRPVLLTVICLASLNQKMTFNEDVSREKQTLEFTTTEYLHNWKVYICKHTGSVGWEKEAKRGKISPSLWVIITEPKWQSS